MIGSERPRVVYTDLPWRTSEIEEAEFSRVGAELVVLRDRSYEAVLAEVRQADVIVNAAFPVTREIIAAASRCQAIVHSGVGVDSIDVASATEAGIIVANVVGYCSDEVSDHALALLLCCARKVIPSNESVKRGRWDWRDYVPMRRIRGSVLGIIGFGNIGRAMAAKSKALGMRCLVYDPMVADEVLVAHGTERASLDELLRMSDFVSIHCPLVDGTRHLIGEKQLRMMKRTAYIINTSRGAIIDERALVRALEEKWIAGAGLDVLVDEPPSAGSRLMELQSVVLTPHTGFYSEESIVELRKRTCYAAIDVLANKWPESVVNPEVSSSPRHLGRH